MTKTLQTRNPRRRIKDSGNGLCCVEYQERLTKTTWREFKPCERLRRPLKGRRFGAFTQTEKFTCHKHRNQEREAVQFFLKGFAEQIRGSK